MSYLRLALVLVIWSLVGIAVARGMPEPSLLFNGKGLLLVVVPPWLVAAVLTSPASLVRAIPDALARRVEDLPPERRAAAASVLRQLGSLTLGFGVAALFLATIGVFQAVAVSPSVTPARALMAGPATGLLAAAYGFALKVLLYDVLAAAVEREEEGLGAELG